MLDLSHGNTEEEEEEEEGHTSRGWLAVDRMRTGQRKTESI